MTRTAQKRIAKTDGLSMRRTSDGRVLAVGSHRQKGDTFGTEAECTAKQWIKLLLDERAKALRKLREPFVGRVIMGRKIS